MFLFDFIQLLKVGQTGQVITGHDVIPYLLLFQLDLTFLSLLLNSHSLLTTMQRYEISLVDPEDAAQL